MALFVVNLVNPSEFNGIERTLVDTSFVKGLSERNGFAFLTVETKAGYKTFSVLEDFDYIAFKMINASLGPI